MPTGIYPRTSERQKQNGLRTRFPKGKAPWNKGLKGYSSDFNRSEEWRSKISAGLKLNPPNYKGGVSTQNELLRKRQAFKHWRKAVFERDNYTCQDCGDRSRDGHRIKIHPHHIKLLSEHPELAYDINNGLTLCYDCHQKRHPNLILSCFKD